MGSSGFLMGSKFRTGARHCAYCIRFTSILAALGAGFRWVPDGFRWVPDGFQVSDPRKTLRILHAFYKHSGSFGRWVPVGSGWAQVGS